MRKAIVAATAASFIATGAFAGGKNEVIIETQPNDPYVPVAAASSSGGNSGLLVVGGVALVALALAATTGSKK